MNLSKCLVAEALGTALLLAIIVGSGIMADQLSGKDVGLALLENTLASVTGFAALVLTFAPVSGAHLNPVITISEAWVGNLPWRRAPAYTIAQIIGAFAGVALAHFMFGETLFSLSTHVRTGSAQWVSEFVASFGLVSVVLACSRSRPSATPFAAAAYLAAAIWFTASCCFVNPAATLARAATHTFVGIHYLSVLGFIIAQVAGSISACILWDWLMPVEKPAQQNTSDTLEWAPTPAFKSAFDTTHH